jgi:hypothetical protein
VLAAPLWCAAGNEGGLADTSSPEVHVAQLAKIRSHMQIQCFELNASSCDSPFDQHTRQQTSMVATQPRKTAWWQPNPEGPHGGNPIPKDRMVATQPRRTAWVRDDFPHTNGPKTR